MLPHAEKRSDNKTHPRAIALGRLQVYAFSALSPKEAIPISFWRIGALADPVMKPHPERKPSALT